MAGRAGRVGAPERTAQGSKLAAAVRGARVAFEVDRFDILHRTGWSVLVKGRIVEIWDSPQLGQARRRPLRQWAPGEKEHVLVILSSTVRWALEAPLIVAERIEGVGSNVPSIRRPLRSAVAASPFT